MLVRQRQVQTEKKREGGRGRYVCSSLTRNVNGFGFVARADATRETRQRYLVQYAILAVSLVIPF